MVNRYQESLTDSTIDNRQSAIDNDPMPKMVPAGLTALGHESLPTEIIIGDESFTQCKIFKNDFFAATAMYQSSSSAVILKVQRKARFLGIPLQWVGRILARKEQAAFEHLNGIEGIPRFISRWDRTGLIREFIPGRTLAKGQWVPDEFHPRLKTLIDAIHNRGLAYVDLEKCENVLVGDDGRPYLFDFQIAWYLPRRWGGELWPARVLRGWLQEGDCYHLLKLQRRTRPDQLTPTELAASYRRAWYVRLHSRITRPLTLIRRAVLQRVDPRRKVGERGRVADES